MTLIELTVVIVVLLALIAVLFVGAQAYKKGADKAACIMTQRNIQQACRSYFNLTPGLADAAVVTFAKLSGAELMADTAPKCPASQTPFVELTGTKLTPTGTLFAPCPTYPGPEVAGTVCHEAADISNW